MNTPALLIVTFAGLYTLLIASSMIAYGLWAGGTGERTFKVDFGFPIIFIGILMGLAAIANRYL